MDLPVFRANRQDREVSAALAEERGLQEMHDDHRREMHAMLDEAWVDRAQDRPNSRSSTSPTCCRSRTSRCEAALLAWRSNRAMIDDVVAARRVALETRMKHLRLAADRAQAQFDIDYLAGEVP